MRRVVLTGPIILIALVAGYAALGSGLDRLSRDNLGLAGMVPEAFRANAWRGAGASDIALERYLAAGTNARRAVLADPIDAGSSSGLGLARLKLRLGVAAEAAFRVAGQLGWRDQTAQIYWMAVSADSGDFGLAAERADALLRQDQRLREQPALIAALEATEGGRKALAARLAQRPEWFGDYWNKLYLLSPPQLANRSLVLDQAALRPPIMRCDDIRTMTVALAEHRDTVRNQAIRARFCGKAVGALLADGGFEAAQLSSTAETGWQFAGEGGLDIRLQSSKPGGKAVVVASTLAQRQVFASQALQLVPGRYRITWRMPSLSSGIAARLTCRQGAGEFLAATPAGPDRVVSDVELGIDCPLQWLELAVDPGAGPIIVDDVTLTRRAQPGP